MPCIVIHCNSFSESEIKGITKNPCNTTMELKKTGHRNINVFCLFTQTHKEHMDVAKIMIIFFY